MKYDFELDDACFEAVLSVRNSFSVLDDARRAEALLWLAQQLAKEARSLR